MNDATRKDIEKAISTNKSIVILGQQGSGKSTLFNEIVEMVLANGAGYKTFMDEVACEADVKYLADATNRGDRVIFTHHAKNREHLIQLFPGLNRDNVYIAKMVKEGTCRMCYSV